MLPPHEPTSSPLGTTAAEPSSPVPARAPGVPLDAVARAAWDWLVELGLPWTPAARRLRARIALVPGMPDVSDAALLAGSDWLLPYLGRARSAADLRALDLTEPLKALIGWDGQRRLDEAAPAHFTTPLGRRVPIDYDAETPTIEARLQELGYNPGTVDGKMTSSTRTALREYQRRNGLTVTGYGTQQTLMRMLGSL